MKSGLFDSVESLKHPNYHEMDNHDRLLHAVLCAYAKHHLGCVEIGWEELGDILHAAICNEIGDDKFCDWVDRLTADGD